MTERTKITQHASLKGFMKAIRKLYLRIEIGVNDILSTVDQDLFRTDVWTQHQSNGCANNNARNDATDTPRRRQKRELKRVVTPNYKEEGKKNVGRDHK